MNIKSGKNPSAPQKRLSISLPTLLVIFGFLIIVGLVWGPFGFKSTGLMEEWFRLSSGDINYVRIKSIGAGPRPLSDLVLYIMTRLTLGSTVGLDYSILFTFFIKGLMTYQIMRILLPQNAAVAFVTGVLFVLYPAEPQPFVMRAAGAHHSLAVDMIAIYLLLVNYKHPTNLRLRVMVLFLVFSCMLYEVTYTTAFLVPLLLVWLDKGVSKRVMEVAAVWYATLALCLAYSLRFYILALSNPNSYAVTQTGVGSSSLPDLISRFVTAMGKAYKHHFTDAWFDAADYLKSMTIYNAYALALALVVGLVTLYLLRRSSFGSSNLRKDIRLYGLFLLLGLMVLGLNYVPYALTNYTWRIYYRTALGASLSLVMIVLIILRLIPNLWIRKSLFLVLTVSSAYLAGSWSLYKQEDLMLQTLPQQELLSDVAEQVPDVKDNTTFIIVADPSHLNVPLYSYRHWTAALRVLYHNQTIRVWLCAPPVVDPAKTPKSLHSCTFGHDTVSGVIDKAAGKKLTFEYAYKEILLFQLHSNDVELLQTVPADYQSGETAENYDPMSLIDQNAVEPPRARVMFLDWPVDEPLCNDTPVPLVNCDRYKAELEMERAADYLSEGNVELGLDALARALLYDPDNAALYFRRGSLYYQQQAWKLAEADYSQAIEIDPTEPHYFTRRGSTYNHQQQMDLAIKDYTRAIELDPVFADAYLERGMIYYKLEQFELALADYRRYVELSGEIDTTEAEALIAQMETMLDTN